MPAIRRGGNRPEATIRVRPPGHDSYMTIGGDIAPGIVPQSLTLSYTWQGPDTASFMVRRHSDIAWADLRVLGEVEVEIGGMLVWSGYVWDVRPSDDDQVSVSCRGRHVILDRQQLNKWYVRQGFRAFRDIQSRVLTYPPGQRGGVVDVDANGGGVSARFPIGAPYLAGVFCGVDLDAGPGRTIKRVRVEYQTSANSSWELYVRGGDNPAAAGGAVEDLFSANLSTAGAGPTWVGGTFTTARRYLQLFVFNLAGSSGATAVDIWARFNHIVVASDTAYESGNTSALTATQVIQDVTAAITPAFAGTSIATTSFIIPELAPEGFTTARGYIDAVNAFHDYVYGVDAAGVFYFRARDTSPEIEIGSWGGARFVDAGDTADELFDTVHVQAVGTDGETLWVTRNATSPRLTAASTSSHYTLQTSAALTEAAAEQIGDRWLDRRATNPTRGSVTASGHGGVRSIATSAGLPAYALGLWAGKAIRIAGRHNPDNAGKGRVAEIASVTYTHATDTATLQLDSRRDHLETLLNRLAQFTGG